MASCAVLGINAYHGDSSAAIVRDGELVAAAEEERFRRIKHWAGLPTESMRFCLREANLNFSDLDHIAINLNPKVNNFRRAFYLLTRRPDLQLVLSRFKKLNKTRTLENAIRGAFDGQSLKAKIHNVEHHLAHMASSFLCSPFPEAVNLSVDGFGDFASAAWGQGRGQELTVDGRVYFPHSLGIFYSALTQYLGFPHFGDEYKVMGLAPYGQPGFFKELRRIVRCKPDGTFELALKFFRHHNENVLYTWNDCSPEVGTLFTPALEELLGPARAMHEPLDQRHKDIARSVQAMYEEALFNLLNALHARYGGGCLTLSGGCAMNSVANGKVYSQTPFKRLYIQPAAGDAGGAIGAALVVAQRLPATRDSGVRGLPSKAVCCEGGFGPSVGPRWATDARYQRSGGIGHLRMPQVSADEGGESQAEGTLTEANEGNEEDRPRIANPCLLTSAPTRVLPDPPIQSSNQPLIHPPIPASSRRLLQGCSAIHSSTNPPIHQSTPPRTNPSPLAPRPSFMAHAYWGPEFSDDDIKALLDAQAAQIERSDCGIQRITDPEELCKLTARAIAGGQVLGWFQGRMEWGPRALGNRSILCDPRRADMKDILNQKIKRRESFRPFAPSILRERVSEWFETDDDVPFMMKVFQVRPEKHSSLPATTHVDGSGRLQTVHRDTNPLYYRLIEHFEALTGVPMVLNTSFNENEPVVCRPDEALDCFLRTRMDVLVLGSYLIRRRSGRIAHETH